MLERLRTFVVVTVMTGILVYITIGASLAYFEGSGVWTGIVNSGWCPPSLCKADFWQH